MSADEDPAQEDVPPDLTPTDLVFFGGAVATFILGFAIAVAVFWALDDAEQVSIDLMDAFPLQVAGVVAALVASFGFLARAVERERSLHDDPDYEPPTAKFTAQLELWERYAGLVAGWAWAAAGGYTIAMCGLASRQTGSAGWIPVAVIVVAITVFTAAKVAMGEKGLREAVLFGLFGLGVIALLFLIANAIT